MALVISTRPLEDALDDAELLRRFDITCLAAPMMVIRQLKTDIESLLLKIDAEAVILTSHHAIEALAATGWAKKPVFCVGERTERLARAAGINIVMKGARDGQELADLVAKTSPYKSIFWPSAVDVGFDLAEPLARHQIELHRYPVYKAATTGRLPDAVIKALTGGEILVLLVYSGRAGVHFVELLKQNKLDDLMQNIHLVAISARVARHCGEGWRKITLAKIPLREAMVDATLEILKSGHHNDSV